MTVPARPVRLVEAATPVGTSRAHVHDPRGVPVSTLVLGHGAGGGIEAGDLAALADALPAAGHRVVLVEAPWRVAGRRVAPAPRTLDLGWLAVLDRLRARGELEGVLVVGGRSAGARVACRTAVVTGAAAALLLAFPLHPPGRPDRMRSEELLGTGVPTHVVQGARDPFGSPEELAQVFPDQGITAVPFADHGFAVPRSAPVTQAEAVGVIVGSAGRALAEWAGPGRR